MPLIVVIVIIHDFQIIRLSISYALISTNLIFGDGSNIGIAIEYGRAYAIADHTLDYGSGAWGATCVEKNFGLSAWNFYFYIRSRHNYY